MDVSKKVFINSAYTAATKVPKKSARDEELVYGQNAFASISAAKSKLGGFADNGLYVSDKSVKLANVDGIAMIASQEPYNVEAYKKTDYTVSDVNQIKLAGTGDVAINADASSTLRVQGFKNVDINGTGDFVVAGGNNTGARSYAFVDRNGNTSAQWADSAASVAAGNLNVKKGTITVEGLVFDDTDDWTSKSGEVDIDHSVVSLLPIAGYANVTLSNGAAATGTVYGGAFRYNGTRAENQYTDGSYTSSTKYSNAFSTSGKLTVSKASIENATGYADATITESTFGTIDAEVYTNAGEYAEVYNEKGDTTAHTTANAYAATTRASGKATITKGTVGEAINGYATVTISDSTINGNAAAGNTTDSSRSNSDERANGTAVSSKSTSITSSTASENGTLTAKQATFGGNITGYNRVTLTDTDVAGTIAATEALGRSFNQADTSTLSSATDAAGNESESSETRHVRVENSTGTVTVTNNKVEKGIIGYSSVNVKNAEIDGDHITAGALREERTTAYQRNTRSDAETITSSVVTRNQETATGTLTATTTTFNIGEAIDGFQTVTLTNAKGTIKEVEGGNEDDALRRQTASVNGITAEKVTSSYTDTATGSFTAKNTIDEFIEIGEDIEGYSKVQLTKAKVGKDIEGGAYSSSYTLDARNLADDSAIVTPFSTDYVEGTEVTSITRKMTGTVSLEQTEVTGGIAGYATITLAKESKVDGDINLFDEDGDSIDDAGSYKLARNYRNNIESRFESIGSSATASLTLKKETTVGGNAYRISKLTMEDKTKLGAAFMATSNSTDEQAATHAARGDSYAQKYAESITAAGTATVGAEAEVGDIDGAKSVTVKSGTVGNLTAFNSTTSAYEKGVSKPGEELTIAGGIADYTALAQYENYYKNERNAVGVATLNSAKVGNLIGFNKVTATETDLAGAIEGGKSATFTNQKYSFTEKGGRTSQVELTNTSESYQAQGAVTINSGAIGGMVISRFQNVTMNRVTGDAGIISGGSYLHVNTASSYIANGEISGTKSVDSTAVIAAGTFSAAGSYTSDSDPAASFAEIGGFTNVKLTSANVGGNIEARNYNEKEIVQSDNVKFYAREFTFASKYVGGVDIVASAEHSAAVGGDINGYTNVTLGGVEVAGTINAIPVDGGGDPLYTMLNTKDAITVNRTADNPMVTFSSAYSSGTTATTALTLKNAAIVKKNANDIAKLTMGPKTAVEGDVTMYNSAVVGSRVIALRGDTYNGSEKSSDSQVANGTVVITGSSGVDTIVGNISGAKSVTATSATMANIEGWNIDAFEQRDASGAGVTTTVEGGAIVNAEFDNGSAGTYKYAEASAAKGKVTLTDTTAGIISGAATVDIVRGEIKSAEAIVSKYAGQSTWNGTNVTSKFEDAENAVGAFTATSAKITDDDIYGFAKVTLTSATAADDVTGGNWAAKGAAINGSGTIIEVEAVTGALTATKSEIGGAVGGYATVKLDESEVKGDITAGNWTWTYDFDWNPVDSSVVATGALTAKDSVIGGEVRDFKTATFEGENSVAGTVRRVASVSVKSGVTEFAADESYIGSTGNDAVAVAAGAILQVKRMDFAEGNDTLSIAGLVRVLGADDTTLVDIEKIAGNGMLAVTDAYYKGDLDGALAGVVVDKALTIVNAGGETSVKSIRTKTEELGDNTASGAQRYDVTDTDAEITGWLCSNAENGFVDTVDWISFNKGTSDVSLAFTVEEDSGDLSKFNIELWKNGKLEDKQTGASSYNFTVATDGNYQLKLELTDAKTGPLAYSLKR